MTHMLNAFADNEHKKVTIELILVSDLPLLLRQTPLLQLTALHWALLHSLLIAAITDVSRRGL